MSTAIEETALSETHLFALGLAAVAFFCLSHWMRHSLVRKVVLWRLKQKRLSQSILKPSTKLKFSNSVFNGLYYGFATLLSLITVLYFWPCWSSEAVQFDDARAASQCGYTSVIVSRLVIAGFFGYYLNEALEVMGPEQRKSRDFVMLVIHHCMCLFFCIAAIYRGAAITTLVTFLFHDFSDVFISLAKIANYENKDLVKIMAFVGLVVSWIGGRLIGYPYMMFKMSARLPVWYTDPVIAVGYTFLCVLYCFHLIWFAMIIKAAATGLSKDPREQEESDSVITAKPRLSERPLVAETTVQQQQQPTPSKKKRSTRFVQDESAGLIQRKTCTADSLPVYIPPSAVAVKAG